MADRHMGEARIPIAPEEPSGCVVVPGMSDDPPPHPRQGQEPLLETNSTSSLSQPRPQRSGQVVDMYNENVMNWLNKRNGATLQGALAFVPWVLQQAYFEGGLDDGQFVIHRGTGAVVFSDASGFTTLTERLARRTNGAEQLSQCLSNFFTPLIDLINAYRGDVIKFAGGALWIYFQAFDDTQSENNTHVPPHGTYGLPDLGKQATAVLRASACAVEIHKRLYQFDTGIDNVLFCLHVAMGYGDIHILQVGGMTPPETHVPRCEYLIAGPPLAQISIAEPLAGDGETCLSPQAWELVEGCVIEGKRKLARPDFHLLDRMDESKYTFPTIKHAAIEYDDRHNHQFKLTELEIIRRYIPFSVFKQIECGTLVYVNEMRNISVIFVNVPGLDVMSPKGATIAQELMVSVQKACYQHEGTVNKFLIDDKGMTFLLVFGLPPLVHTDDPTRAVLACFDMLDVFKGLNLVGRFGVTTGRSYCGVCGSARRMEYTVLGDIANVSSRLMCHAKPGSILCDEETKNRCSTEVIFNALAPLKPKGKDYLIPVFQPVKKDPVSLTGLGPVKKDSASQGPRKEDAEASRARKIRFPWYDHPFAGASVGGDSHMSSAMQMRVKELCGVKTWEGIVRVQQMLGGSFSKALHQGEQIITLQEQPSAAKPPAGSPFAEGGCVVIMSEAGLGKTELAEHIVISAAMRLQMLPVFGTMGPRPGDGPRMASELIRSTMGIYRMLDTEGKLPKDDFAALQRLTPAEVHEFLPSIEEVLVVHDSQFKPHSEDILESTLTVVCALLEDLVTRVAVVLVLQFEIGTSLFPRALADQEIFWRAVERLAEPVRNEKSHGKAMGHKPLVMVIVCREEEKGNLAVQMAREQNCFIHLRGLTEENILEYMSNYLSVPEQMIPQVLRVFVAKVTSGNPRHIRETLDQLLENCIQVHLGANSQPKHIECKDIDKVNISSWQHTTMIGGTVCQLEALDPLEAAVLKMSTCFTGSFTLPDLAASTCSRWADATHFDFLRLFKAIRKLVEAKIIEEVDATEEHHRHPSGMDAQNSEGNGFGKTRYFATRNLLIRAVGGSMVLEAQKKSVKRQALIDRALWRELPARMEDLAKKRNAQHIPWYYEQAFRRM